MAIKVYMSNLTHLSIEDQKGILKQGVPGWPDVAMLIDELKYRDMHGNCGDKMAERNSLIRPTTRPTGDTIYVAILPALSKHEDDFPEFMRGLKRRKSELISINDKFKWTPSKSITVAVKGWLASRRQSRLEGAAHRGGERNAERAEKKFWDGFAKIKDRWHLAENSKDLMKEAGIGHHDTVRANLGYTRWEWRRLPDAKRERVLKQKEKELRNAER